jgi:hypothetical protein
MLLLLLVACSSPTNPDTPQEPLTVTLDSKGTVTSSPAGITCGESCTVSFARDSTVTLRAQAAEGWEFVQWQGGCTGTSTTCTLTMSAARNVTAVFRQVDEGQPEPGNFRLTIIKVVAVAPSPASLPPSSAPRAVKAVLRTSRKTPPSPSPPHPHPPPPSVAGQAATAPMVVAVLSP